MARAPRISVRRHNPDRLRLDTPAGGGRRNRANYDPDAFGRLTERVARFLGTGRYLVIQTVIVALWILVNIIPVITFDPYTFTFLTLILSLQAAYAAPLILLAQNRQDDRDRANLIEDRDRANRNLEDTEFLARELADVRLALGDVVTRDFLRSELRELLAELGDGRDTTSAQAAATTAATKARKARDKDRGKRKRARERELRRSGEEQLAPVNEPQRPDTEHQDAAELAAEIPRADTAADAGGETVAEAGAAAAGQPAADSSADEAQQIGPSDR